MFAGGALLFVATYIAYFFHGIGTMGPRYYYEALPWFLLLAARGLQTGVQSVRSLGISPVAARLGALGVLGCLTIYALTFYYPHLLDRRADFAALSGDKRYDYPFVEQTLMGPRLTGFDRPTLVLVGNEDVFKTISAMNCADLDLEDVSRCPVLFVHAGDADAAEVIAAYPDREVFTAEAAGQTVTLHPAQSSP